MFCLDNLNLVQNRRKGGTKYFKYFMGSWIYLYYLLVKGSEGTKTVD